MKILLSILLGISLNCGMLAQQVDVFPDNIEVDSAHAPFLHGIASGDPLADGIILWTRITPDNEDSDTSLTVYWIIAEDDGFNQVVAQGSSTTDSSRDFTVKVDVGGLMPDNYYYYRFADELGNHSASGRTRTLPVGNVERIQLGVASCANVFYGYFNAYRQLANNDDIAAVVHLGDFIYNNDGRKSPVRIPEPIPETLNETNSEEEWADRHAYYHFDIDLRAMLAKHPLIVIWDNHDIHSSNHFPAINAWLNWAPVREDPSDFGKLYRKLSFGELADLYMPDIRLFSEMDTLPNGEFQFLGQQQFDWLTGNLLANNARWQLIGSQKNYATWNLGWVADLFGLSDPFFTTSNWDGRLESRKRLNSFFMNNSIDNIVFLTGDAHMGLLADIDPDPFENDFDYDHNTGEGSLGVEFLPSGVTGRNLDDRGIPLGLANTVESISMNINPHQQYLNMVQNGYGLIDINKDSLTAYICYNNIVIETDEEWCHGPFIVYNGANHWKRPNQSYSVPTSAEGSASTAYYVSALFPNPAKDKMSFTLSVRTPVIVSLQINSIDGKERLMQEKEISLERGHQRIDIDVSEYPSGTYSLMVVSSDGFAKRKFVVAR